MPQLIPERAPLRCRRIREPQCLTARDESDARAAFMKESREVDGRRPTANDGDLTPPKPAEIAVCGSMRDEGRRQPGEHRRHVRKMRDPDRENDCVCPRLALIVEPEMETVRVAFEPCELLLFELGHQTPLKREAVGPERVEAHGDASVVVLGPDRFAKALQRQCSRRIGQIRRKTVRLERHPVRHPLAPDLHGVSENPEIDSGRLEVRRERSEEHTSELQSPCNLVCRLLLEKKKKTKIHFPIIKKKTKKILQTKK